MAFREVRVFEVREVLRLWLAGEGIRATERLVGFDRKTVRRYVEAAIGLGLVRDGGDEQLTDVFIGLVVEAVRPHGTDGHGEAWRLLMDNHDEIAAWVEGDLTAVKIHELLARRGVAVPCRTVQRYVAGVCGRTRGRGPTVRVADGEPGDELQVDFGRMGLMFDPATGRNRVTYALIFTACLSRHCFVWLTHRQTTEAVIAGCEAAWAFLGGIFKTLIPDNMSAVVDAADALLRLGPLYQLHPGRSGGLVRHHDRLHLTTSRSLLSPRPYGRTLMIVLPLIRSVGLKAATASSRVETLPMFVRSRPSRTRWTISLS
jgi:transposase